MAISKVQKKAERLAKAEARRAAAGEVMEARMRTAFGFGATYLVTQLVPSFIPSVSEFQSTIDLVLAGLGTYFALTDDGPFGDYALGAALVGGTQTLDNVGTKINEWLSAA